MGVVEAKGMVNGEVVAEATFLFVIRDRLVKEEGDYGCEDRSDGDS